MRAVRVVVPSICALLVASPAAAQNDGTSGYVDVDGAWVAPWDAAVQHGLALSVAPSIRRDRGQLSVTNDGSVTVADRSHYYVQNTASASIRSREHRGLIVEAGAGVAGLAYRSSGFRSVGEEPIPIARGLLQLQGHVRADFALDRWGFSLTADGSQNYGGVVHDPWGLEAGMTRELRRVLLYATARADRFRKYDTVLVYTADALQTGASTLSGGGARPLTETFRSVQPLLTVTTGATMTVGRSELTGEVGVQQGQRALDPGRPRATRGWREFLGSMAASYRLAPRTLLRLSGGMYPTDYIRQLPRGVFLSVGLRLERGQRQPVDWYRPTELPAFRVDTLAGGARLLQVRAPRALSVDLSADFTDWTPVPMRRATDDEWEAVLPIAPGTYRVSVRVDGGPWSAPPGLVGVSDEFNGEVGVIVIK